MWSLILHGTLLDGIADILEEMKALENQGPWPENGPKTPIFASKTIQNLVFLCYFGWFLCYSGLFRPLLEPFRQAPRGYDWTLGWSMIFVFFVYVLLTNITVMNMLIGIVCEVVSEVGSCLPYLYIYDIDIWFGLVYTVFKHIDKVKLYNTSMYVITINYIYTLIIYKQDYCYINMSWCR